MPAEQDTKRFGRFELAPVVFTLVEAWTFAHGTWHKLSKSGTWDMLTNATELTADAFHAAYPSLPALPEVAFR